MPLYRWNDEGLSKVETTTFEEAQLRERYDLQRLLRDKPEALEDGLFIIAEEFSNWQDSYRSIDLLALDKQGHLVVIELKRTQTGDHSELQAIRYAAMLSTMTLEQVVDAHRLYLEQRAINEDARTRILAHLEVFDVADRQISTARPRIILASAGFSTELTTSVLWLRDGDMDIRCVKLQLYKIGDELLMDTGQVIPLPETADYLVKVRERREEEERRLQQVSPMKRIPGADAFRGVIEEVPEDDRQMLGRLYEWAVALGQDELAILETRLGSMNRSLWPYLRNVDRPLAIIYRAGYANALDLRPEVIRAHAPKSNGRIAELLGLYEYGTVNHLRLYTLPDGLLEALTDAYREADGPPTTPRPDTAPGSPAPAG